MPNANKVNMSELATMMANKWGVEVPVAAAILSEFRDALRDGLINREKMEIRGFGSMFVREGRPRPARNPQTGESLGLVNSSSRIIFRPNGAAVEMA